MKTKGGMIMSNAKKIAVIFCFLFVAVLAVMVFRERKEIIPNIYEETPYDCVEINFTEVSEISESGISYDTLEEIKEAPEDVFSLRINDAVINNPDSISQFKNLKRLDISNCEINDFSFLKKLRKLKSLNISYSSSDDFASIQCLPNKEKLLYMEIAYCTNSDSVPITDINYLKDFTGLIYLGLGGNDIRNLDPVSNMKALETLYLYDNFHIETLKPLYSLHNLKTVIVCPTYQFTEEDIKQLGDPYISDMIYYD